MSVIKNVLCYNEKRLFVAKGRDNMSKRTMDQYADRMDYTSNVLLIQ